MRIQRIESPKHPGAVFLKVAGTKADFLAKFYPGVPTAVVDACVKALETVPNTRPLPFGPVPS
jgi:hypothetical protein